MVFAMAIFCSAFLVFQVQPIIARFILPYFGGSPGVWTTCMLFFQVGLLGGYFYAHILAKHVRLKHQPFIHITLLFLSLFMLPITPEIGHMNLSSSQTLDVTLLLLITVGFQFILLSASAPLIQHWFTDVYPTKSPFRLYSLSNIGSLLALLSYPFLIEPAMKLKTQSFFWSAGYVAFFAMIIWGAWPIISRKKSKEEIVIHSDSSESHKDKHISWIDRLIWLALSAFGSIILIACTNQMSQNIAVIPFLWIIPLSFYLLSFIICFNKDHWYYRPFWLLYYIISVSAVVYLLYDDYAFTKISIAIQIGIYISLIFSSSMLCHGELVRRRPHVSNLTSFYLFVALGGALGGIFVGIIAPLIFNGYWELHIVLVLIAAFVTTLISFSLGISHHSYKYVSFMTSSLIGITILTYFLYQHINTNNHYIFSTRNFYGVLHVLDKKVNDSISVISLCHGRIDHGKQILHDVKQRIPISYYGVNSGVGIALLNHSARFNKQGHTQLKVGAIGLGAGTVAAYGAAGDYFRFYEINDQVHFIAKKYFTYLNNSKAKIDVIIGDARTSLRKELYENGGQEFDVIIVDAFSGDAIPIHLLTNEAIDLYRQHLKDDGIIAIHVSNLHINLLDVTRQLAKKQAMDAIHIRRDLRNPVEYSNSWVLLTNNELFLYISRARRIITPWKTKPAKIIWTDDYSNLFQTVKW